MPSINFCQCGCGETTRNRFAPGHDQRLYGMLARAARSGDQFAYGEIVRLGWIAKYEGRRTVVRSIGRKFGIEIECFVHSQRDLETALQAAGIMVHVEQYNHTTRNHWKIITDGSLNSYDADDTRNMNGIELVSPPMTDLTQLETVCRVLAEVGAKVNRTAGMHVHHEIRDMTIEAVKLFVTNYQSSQASIDAVVAPSRRAAAQNQYCKPIGSDYTYRLNGCHTLSDIQYAYLDRYHVVNLTSYPKYGTLEIRQHQGTVEFEKISNWVKLGQRMIDEAIAGTRIANIETIVSGETLDYFVARRATFARRAERMVA